MQKSEFLKINNYQVYGESKIVRDECYYEMVKLINKEVYYGKFGMKGGKKLENNDTKILGCKESGQGK